MNILNTFTLSARQSMMILLVFFGGCLGSSGGGIPVVISAPTITAVMPTSGATVVPQNSSVNATFNKALDPSTVTIATFTLSQGTTPVAGHLATVPSLGKVAAFYPTSNLMANTVYTATVTTGVKDALGNAFAGNYSWSFTTGPATDLAAPTVGSVTPLNSATGVALNSSVNATFSKSMDPITITSSTFTLAGTSPVSGSVSYAGTTATFHPTSNLAANVLYTATITSGASGAKDMQSNALASNYTWSFTTGAALAAGPAPVNLGTAGNYAILAETLVSTSSGTAITGDVGISPAAATYIQGFSLTLNQSGCFSSPTPSTLVTGKLYAADYNTNGCPTPANLTTAIGDMMIAYTDAAGRTLPDHTELGAGDISGLTLTPGLYKWGTGVLINTDVTLSGGPNDVWIFQISGNLTMASATHMILAGGALPKNIFWQVGGGVGVAIGTTADFEGVILAAKAITLNTGATGNGRLLAQTAVTLLSNAVTQPAP